MRLGELLLGRWEDVNMLACEIFARLTKNGKSRTPPLTQRAVRLLTNLRQGARPDEFIFNPERTGRRRRQTTVVFEKAVDEAGLDDFTFHDLIRTFATRLRDALELLEIGRRLAVCPSSYFQGIRIEDSE